MNIDEIIKQSLQKLSTDFELRKSFFLNILHINIDKLVENSSRWFDGDVPSEYSEIISSLMNLSVSFYEEIEKYNDIITDQKYESFDPEKVINNIVEEIKLLINFQNISIINDSECNINTSKNIFRDSLYNIMLCLSQYLSNDTDCSINIISEFSSVKIMIDFHNLSEGIPDLYKLSKVFYSVSKENEMHMRIGLAIPIENMKKIGGITNIYESNHYKDISLIISFPSSKFLETVNDIRKLYKTEKNDHEKGVVLISVNDKLLEMIIRDSLDDENYQTEVVNPEKINLAVIDYNPHAVIIDYKNIMKTYESIEDFQNKYDNDINTLIIYSSDNDPVDFGNITSSFNTITFPFEIDSLLDKIN